jgi:hypothetical protein
VRFDDAARQRHPEEALKILRELRERPVEHREPTPEEVAESEATARRIRKTFRGVAGVFARPPAPPMPRLKLEIPVVELERLDPLEVVVVGDERGARGKRDGDRRAPGRIPIKYVEQACQLHERKGYGRRRISENVPGLTPYQADQILKWYRVGKPAGLWLDAQGRLKWSKAISATRDGLLLPRV